MSVAVWLDTRDVFGEDAFTEAQLSDGGNGPSSEFTHGRRDLHAQHRALSPRPHKL